MTHEDFKFCIKMGNFGFSSLTLYGIRIRIHKATEYESTLDPDLYSITYTPDDDEQEAQVEHDVKDCVQLEHLTAGPLVQCSVHAHLRNKFRNRDTDI